MPHVQVRAGSELVYASASTPSDARRRSRDQRTTGVPMPSDHRKLTVLNKLKIYQSAVREIAPLCDGSEFAVLAEIMDRSIGYGKWDYFGTVAGLANGSKNGCFSGCGKSESTIKRALAGLQAKGIISLSAYRNEGTRMSINIHWTGEEPMIAIPKRLQGKTGADDSQVKMTLAEPKRRSKMTEGYKQEDHSFLTVSHDKTGYPDERPSEPEEVASPKHVRAEKVDYFARDNLNDLVQRTSERSSKKQEKNLERAKQRGNPMAFETIWRTAVSMHYPEAIVAPAWTKAQHGIIIAIAKKWTQGGKLMDFAEFFEWCVVSWPAIMRQQFKWMKKLAPPATPDFRFWAKFHEEFLNCYHSGKLSKWMRAADRTRLEFLKARGKTHEEALFIIAEEQAREAMEERNNKAMRAVQVRERQLVERQKELKKQEDRMAVGVPAHPKSEIAQKAAGMQHVAPTHAPEADVSIEDLERQLAELQGWTDDEAN